MFEEWPPYSTDISHAFKIVAIEKCQIGVNAEYTYGAYFVISKSPWAFGVPV